MGWASGEAGLVRLPSGRLVRGRSLRVPLSPVQHPDFGLYLLGTEPAPSAWESRWVRWPDFALPTSPRLFRSALVTSLERVAVGERVEFACRGGLGRTGTALACLAALDGGLTGREAVAYVRSHYSPKAVETPWQRWFVSAFANGRRPHSEMRPDA